MCPSPCLIALIEVQYGWFSWALLFLFSLKKLKIKRFQFLGLENEWEKLLTKMWACFFDTVGPLCWLRPIWGGECAELLSRDSANRLKFQWYPFRYVVFEERQLDKKTKKKKTKNGGVRMALTSALCIGLPFPFACWDATVCETHLCVCLEMGRFLYKSLRSKAFSSFFPLFPDFYHHSCVGWGWARGNGQDLDMILHRETRGL